MNEPAALNRLAVEINYYTAQTAQNILEIGRRLIEAKKLVPHGEWVNWLKNEVNYTHHTACKFMNCAEKFSNVASMRHLNPTKLISLLALPETETQAFLEAKAAEGRPVEDMPVRELREEVKAWKRRAEEAEAAAREARDEADSLSAANEELRTLSEDAADMRERYEELDAAHAELEDRFATEQVAANGLRDRALALEAEVRQLKAHPMTQVVEQRVEIEPPDYEMTKRRLASASAQREELERERDELARRLEEAKKAAQDQQGSSARLPLLHEAVRLVNAVAVLACFGDRPKDYLRSAAREFHLAIQGQQDRILRRAARGLEALGEEEEEEA